MFYMLFDELRNLPKNEAKKIFSEANSSFIQNERWLYRFLIFTMLQLEILGIGLGSYISNSTHLFIYTGIAGALIGYVFMRIVMHQKLKPYIKAEINEHIT